MHAEEACSSIVELRPGLLNCRTGLSSEAGFSCAVQDSSGKSHRFALSISLQSLRIMELTRHRLQQEWLASIAVFRVTPEHPPHRAAMGLARCLSSVSMTCGAAGHHLNWHLRKLLRRQGSSFCGEFCVAEAAFNFILRALSRTCRKI